MGPWSTRRWATRARSDARRLCSSVHVEFDAAPSLRRPQWGMSYRVLSDLCSMPVS